MVSSSSDNLFDSICHKPRECRRHCSLYSLHTYLYEIPIFYCIRKSKGVRRPCFILHLTCHVFIQAKSVFSWHYFGARLLDLRFLSPLLVPPHSWHLTHLLGEFTAGHQYQPWRRQQGKASNSPALSLEKKVMPESICHLLTDFTGENSPGSLQLQQLARIVASVHHISPTNWPNSAGFGEFAT